MLKKKHLKLVYSNCQQTKADSESFLKSLFDNFKYLFISQNKKIETLRNILINMYRDYEITSGQTEVPYFVKAESKINKIIQEGKINYYYKKLRKFKDYMNSI